MFNSSSGQERRRSMTALSVSERARPRSASTGVIEISPGSTGWSSQRGPATPCFVSPRMAFSTQFSYDSPIQVLTSKSPCVFKPMSVTSLNGRWSLRRLPLKGKSMLTVILLSLAACLYLVRTTMERESACTTGSCHETAHDERLQRYIRSAPEPAKYHTLTEDLNNPDVEGLSKSLNVGSGEPVSVGYSEPKFTLKSRPKMENHRVSIIVGSNIDEKEEVEVTKARSNLIESTNLAGAPSDNDYLSQPRLPPVQEDRDIKAFKQFVEKSNRQKHLSDWEIASRMTKYSSTQREIPDYLDERFIPESGKYRKSLGNQIKYPETQLRLDRLPPGVNPMRYLREL